MSNTFDTKAPFQTAASILSHGLQAGAYLLVASSPMELERIVSSVSNDFLFPFKAVPRSGRAKGPDVFSWGADASCYFVMDNVGDEIALRFLTEDRSATSCLDIPNKVRDCLVAVGLGGIAENCGDISPWELSGGQQQRLVAALLIAKPPPLAIGLNPMVYVDQSSRSHLYRRVSEAFAKAGSVFILAGESDGIKRDLPMMAVSWNGGQFHAVGVAGMRKTPSGFGGISAERNDSHAVVKGKVLLSLGNLEWRYPNGRRGVSVRSLEIHSGSVYAVCGPNAGGKSSLLRAMSSNYTISRSSTMNYLGSPIRNPFRELVRTGTMTCTFQDANIHAFPGTVEEVIKDRLPDGLTADDYGLDDYLSKDLIASPFWVKQAVSVICALSTAPKILLLDEPMDGFGYELFGMAAQEQIIALCRNGAAVMAVTHDPELARGCATDYIWVEEGSVDCPVSSESVRAGQANPKLLQWLGHL